MDEDFPSLVYEFGQYLSDHIPPLLAADCVESLMKCPPDVVAAGIRSWVGHQHRTLSVSDYLFHALKKIHLMGEYRVLPVPEIHGFIEKLKPYILSYCPKEEIELLARSLNSIDSMVEAAPARLDVVYGTTKGSGKPEQAPLTSSLETELGKINIFLQRLKQEIDARGNATGDLQKKNPALIADVLVQTARASHDSSELEKAFEYIRSLGIHAGAEDAIRALGRNLPDWTLTPADQSGLPEDKNLSALRRIVVDAPDVKQAGSRFHQMIQTAIERVNAGHLHQAATMIDLAEKMIAAKEVEQNLVDNIRNRGHEDIQLENLRKFAEIPEQQPQLQKFLNFFYALTAGGLLDSLRQEEKRERRRLIMAIIEVHRDDARSVILARLRVPYSQNFTPEEGYFRRNLLYLLRRIPPTRQENETELIDVVASHTELEYPLMVVKEAIGYLGYFKKKQAEEVLRALLLEVESSLSSGKRDFDREELLAILDRICGAFARAGTPSGRRLLLDHAFSRKAKLGDTMARLSDLSTQDLAGDPLTIERLLSALHASLPMKVLGFMVRTKQEDLKKIVQALSGTSDPAVRQVFEDLKQRFPDSPAAKLAAKASPPPPQTPEKRGSAESASSLEGDLQLFGIPGLLQNLTDHALTGTLQLRRPDGEMFATLELANGMLASARTGVLSDEMAIYQLLECPQLGTFHFTRTIPEKEPTNVKPLFPMVLEGVRRYDELSEARVVLPDHVRLAGSGLQPAAFPEEKDGMLFRNLWNVVRKGGTPLECETLVPFDSYRIRRLLVHWFQSGSITIIY